MRDARRPLNQEEGFARAMVALNWRGWWRCHNGKVVARVVDYDDGVIRVFR